MRKQNKAYRNKYCNIPVFLLDNNLTEYLKVFSGEKMVDIIISYKIKFLRKAKYKHYTV